MKELNFKLTQEELRVIFDGLGELPAKMAFDLIVKLQKQQLEQQQQKEDTEQTKEVKK
jgi:hypothetical protein